MKLTLFKSLQFRLPFLVLLGVIPTTILAIAFASSSATNIIHQETAENLALKANALNSGCTQETEQQLLVLDLKKIVTDLSSQA